MDAALAGGINQGARFGAGGRVGDLDRVALHRTADGTAGPGRFVSRSENQHRRKTKAQDDRRHHVRLTRKAHALVSRAKIRVCWRQCLRNSRHGEICNTTLKTSDTGKQDRFGCQLVCSTTQT